MRRFTFLPFCIVASLSALACGLPANNSDISHVLVRKDSSAQPSDLEKRIPGFPGCPTCEDRHLSPYLIGDAFIAVINGTPYRWRRTWCHSYQMKMWKEERWPEYIEPGQAISHLCRNPFKGWEGEDTAADVTYELEGTKEPASFNIQYRVMKGYEDDRFKIEVRLKDGLKKLKTGRRADDEMVDLKFHSAPAGVSWMISGTEGSFDASSNAKNYQADLDQPGTWMQDLFPAIKDVPLRQLIMIRSHHAGLWEGSMKGIVARDANCLTQEMDLGEQLLDGGVRVLDVRAYKKGDTFYVAHGTKEGGTFYGCVGQKVEDLIEVVNRFNDEHPGELIIWDFHRDTFDADNHHRPLNVEDRVALYKLLQERLHHRAEMPEEGDVSVLPIKDYIGNKTSSVILRFAKQWLGQDSNRFPSSKHGFVDSERYPVDGKWSDTSDGAKMAEHQLSLLYHRHRGRGSRTFNLEWILTQTKWESAKADETEDIRALGRETMPLLRVYLWNAMTIYKYPSWITLDGIVGRDTRDIVKAMNYCFTAGQCGDWVLEPRDPVFI